MSELILEAKTKTILKQYFNSALVSNANVIMHTYENNPSEDFIKLTEIEEECSLEIATQLQNYFKMGNIILDKFTAVIAWRMISNVDGCSFYVVPETFEWFMQYVKPLLLIGRNS